MLRSSPRCPVRQSARSHRSGTGPASTMFPALFRRSSSVARHTGAARTAGQNIMPWLWPWQSASAPARESTRTCATVEDSPGSTAPKVVILGGGFGGLYTAVRLASLFWPRGKKPQVTLVDQSERFVFKPLLYELLNGTATELEVAPTYGSLLEPYPIRFIQSKVVGAQPESILKDGGSAGGGVVELVGGAKLDYDWLVVALGAEVDTRGVPGVREHAVPFNTLEDALKVRQALESIETKQSGNIVVVGAGFAGVELACVLAERLRDKGLAATTQVSIVTPGQTVLEGAGAGQREAAEEVLGRLGVQIITGTRVVSVDSATQPDAVPTAAILNLDDRPTVGAKAMQAAAGVADATAAAATAAATAASGFAAAASSAAETLRDPAAASRAAAESVKAAAGAVSAAAADPVGTAQSAAEAVRQAASTTSNAASTAADSAEPSVHAAGEAAAAAAPTGPRQLPVDLVLWTAGNSPTTKSARQGFPFPTTDKGSVRTDATLKVLSHSRVFALGDVCMADQGYVQDAGADTLPQEPSGTSFPATAQVAFQQADYAAWNIWAAMMGRPLLPFRYQHLGSMMSLGTFNAAVDLPIPVPDALQSTIKQSPLGPVLDTLGIKLGSANGSGPGGVTLEGPLAAVLRRAAYLYRQPTGEQRLSVAAEWLSKASNIAAVAYSSVQERATSAR